MSGGLGKDDLRSWGGDSVKHSPNDIDTDSDGLARDPNLKGGNWVSAPFEANETEFVVNPFVRTRDGRLKDDFLRLLSGQCQGLNSSTGAIVH